MVSAPRTAVRKKCNDSIKSQLRRLWLELFQVTALEGVVFSICARRKTDSFCFLIKLAKVPLEVFDVIAN